MGKEKYQVTGQYRERETTVSEDQKSTGVGNIREAILSVDPEAYNGIFEKLDQAENSEIPLHHAIGTENAKNGRVISFNVAGSSFAQPLRYEKNLAGKSNVFVEDGDTRVHIREGKENKEYIYTSQKNEKVKLSGKEVKDKAKELLDQEFGPGGALGYEDIREKVSPDGKKIKYSISGPRLALFGDTSWSGTFNAGDYKIESTREYVCNLGLQQLETLQKDEEFMKSGEPILFTFIGHSRGAVGVVEGAMMLKHVIRDQFPDLEKRIRFETLLYDPVPGPEVRSGVNQAINLKEQTKEMKDLAMDSFDENDHTTILYSMGCNHRSGFDPMKIMGADTIILTGHSHDEGLKDLETQFDVNRRKAYINAQNGEAYRASGLCEMPKGVYVADENGIVVPVKDMKTLEKVMEKAYIGGNTITNDRIRRINEACTDIKAREGSAASLEDIFRGFDAHDPFYIRSSKEFRKMRKGFEELMELARGNKWFDTAAIEKRNELKKLALDYLLVKEGNGPHSSLTQGRISVAKNIVSFLDDTRQEGFEALTEMKMDQRPKTNDIRMAYIENTQSSLMQNMDFMNSLCEKYLDKKPVEAEMFLNTLSGMLTDRYFLNHKDSLMPHPLTDTLEHPDVMKPLDTMLGDGNNSLFGVYKNSPAVKNFVSQMLRDKEVLKSFSESKDILKTLDSLNQKVMKEVEQKQNQVSQVSANQKQKESMQEEKVL